MRSEGIAATDLPLDVTDEASVASAARTVAEEHRRLDILVNDVGIWNTEGDGAPSRTSPAVIRETMEANFVATVAVTQALLPLLRASEAGRIVDLSSTLGSLDANSDPLKPPVRRGCSPTTHPRRP